MISLPLRLAIPDPSKTPIVTISRRGAFPVKLGDGASYSLSAKTHLNDLESCLSGPHPPPCVLRVVVYDYSIRERPRRRLPFPTHLYIFARLTYSPRRFPKGKFSPMTISRAKPVPRAELFRTYWYFAAERQQIFFRRLRGEPPPWTDDDILSDYKFCNVYRASDRVSQFLIRHVIYGAPHSAKDLVFRTILFRLFNRIETWRFLEDRFGSVDISTYDAEAFAALLGRRHKNGSKIFGGAFILCANKAFGFDKKHENYLALVQTMLNDNLPRRLLAAASLEEVYSLLLEYPLIGPFMAYQIAIDLNYTEVLDYSENSFTKAGPGALRGISKCFVDTGGFSAEEIIHWVVDGQERFCEKYDIEFPTLWGRRLKAIDCQGLFCEVDKYTRVAFPELKSERKRIKSRFEPTGGRIAYFYPPKWGINEAVREYLEDRGDGERGVRGPAEQIPLLN